MYVCAYYAHTCAHWRMWMWVWSCYRSYVQVTGQHLVSGPHILPSLKQGSFMVHGCLHWLEKELLEIFLWPNIFPQASWDKKCLCYVCVSCLAFVWAWAIWTQVRLIWQENTFTNWAITPVSVHWFLNWALLLD